jgi:hypothetical protein
MPPHGTLFCSGTSTDSAARMVDSRPIAPLGHQPAGQDGLGVVAPHEPLHDHPAGRLGGGKAVGRIQVVGGDGHRILHGFCGPCRDERIWYASWRP